MPLPSAAVTESAPPTPERRPGAAAGGEAGRALLARLGAVGGQPGTRALLLLALAAAALAVGLAVLPVVNRPRFYLMPPGFEWGWQMVAAQVAGAALGFYGSQGKPWPVRLLAICGGLVLYATLSYTAASVAYGGGATIFDGIPTLAEAFTRPFDLVTSYVTFLDTMQASGQFVRPSRISPDASTARAAAVFSTITLSIYVVAAWGLLLLGLWRGWLALQARRASGRT